MDPSRSYLRLCVSDIRLRQYLVSSFYCTSSSSQRMVDCARLGVSPTASKKEIKAAYFHKAKSVHPDTAGGQGAEFAELAAAYERLMEVGGSSREVMGGEAGPPRPPRPPRERAYWDEMRRRRRMEQYMQWRQRQQTEGWEYTRPRNSKETNDAIRINLGTIILLVIAYFMVMSQLMKLRGINYTDGCMCPRCQSMRRMRQERALVAQRENAGPAD